MATCTYACTSADHNNMKVQAVYVPGVTHTMSYRRMNSFLASDRSTTSDVLPCSMKNGTVITTPETFVAVTCPRIVLTPSPSP